MNIRFALLLGFIGGFLAAASLRADLPAGGLDWATLKQSVSTPETTQPITVTFKFQNRSDRPVTLTQLISSCSCTVARLDKKRYEPGEAGAVQAVFDPTGRQGEHIKFLTVQTDAVREPAKLTLEVTISPTMVVLPKLLLWLEPAAERKPKTIRVEFKEAVKISSLEAVPSTAAFQAKVQVSENPAVWNLVVTPAEGLVPPVLETLAITAYTRAGDRLVTWVHVQVR